MREDVKLQVQQATDIVALIGEQVALKPRGREFRGLCPFHDDTNPSLYVSPAKQIYKCFACGAGGDCFSFVMDYHKMDFPQALRYLADRAGIALPRNTGPQSGSPNTRRLLLQANQQALQFFQQQLAEPDTGRPARQYLQQRHIDPQTAQRFALGFAPDRWDALATTAQRKGWPLPPLEQVGLLTRRPSAPGHYDRFRARLIFPILDELARPIAFGGRILPGASHTGDQAPAKYLNSPESLLFNKSATLYGLHLAKTAIIRSRTAVIVEGYTDVIAAHQHGFDNVVATLGTALTADHARLLVRLCEKVILVFDADQAGQKAADRALEVFFEQPLDICIAILPQGQDPADLLHQPDGPDRWQQALQAARDAIAFTFARLESAYRAADSLAGRQKIAQQFIDRLAQLGLADAEPTRRALVCQHLADLLGLDSPVVDQLLRKASGPRRHRPNAPRPHTQPAAPPAAGPRRQLERLIVACLLQRPDLFHSRLPDGSDLAESFLPGDLADPDLRRLYQRWYQALLDRPDHDSTPALRAVLDEEALFRLAVDLQLELDQLTDQQPEQVPDCLESACRAWLQVRAQQEYEQDKMRLRQSDRPDPADTDPAVQQLVRAIELARNHPHAGRAPRLAR